MTDDLVFRTAREQLDGLAAREFSARELLAAHVSQLERVNPAVNAVVSLDLAGAERAAAAVDDTRMRGGRLGALAGIPMSFKDTHATAGLRTTYGSPLFADNVPDADDEIVARLMAAGVIRVGKTNVPEFAAGSHTFNPVFGLTRNPYDLSRSAGGSSGGAAVALACGLQPLADGSDMGGSLRNPASFSNVVGLRPTPGRVPDPQAGVAYLPLGVQGPMARTVADVGLMLSVISGRHPGDPISLDEDAAAFGQIPPTSLRGLRVAYAPTLGDRIPVDPDVLDVLAAAARTFEDLGAEVETACVDLDGSDEVFRTLRAALFELAWGAALDETPDAFKPDLAENIRAGRALRGHDVALALAGMTRLQHEAAAFFAEYDVLLAPAAQVPPFDASLDWPSEVAGVAMPDYLTWMASCCLITPLGVPALSMPAGFTPAGLPVGLQMIGRARGEHRLLALAAAFEEATQYGRRRPAIADA